MSLVCSDSCYNGITREKSLWNAQANHLFKSISVTWLRFQSNALKFSMCQMRRQTCGTRWWKKRRGSTVPEAEFQERIWKEWACLQSGGNFPGFGFYCPSVFKAGRPDSENSNGKWQVEIPDTGTPLGLTGMASCDSQTGWSLYLQPETQADSQGWMWCAKRTLPPFLCLSGRWASNSIWWFINLAITMGLMMVICAVKYSNV